MEDAVLAKALIEAMPAVPAELGTYLKTTFDRATSTRLLPDGARLSLWSLPVLLTLEQPAVAPLHLAPGLDSLRAQSALRELFEPGNSGWVMALPLLFTPQQLGDLSLPVLMDIPRQMRASVRGERTNTSLPVAQAEISPGEHALHLLFVTYNPSGTLTTPLSVSTAAQERVSHWLLQSFAKQGIAGPHEWLSLNKPPRLFAGALDDAQRLCFSAHLHHDVYTAIKRTATRVQGLSAHVCAHPPAQGRGQPRVSVSLVSYLTQKVLGRITLPAYTNNAIEELGSTTALLRSLGLPRVTLKPTPLPSPIRHLPSARSGGEHYSEPSSGFAPLH